MTGASVSVVVPVRDPGPWLAETLASIARQTAPPLETLVIDDGNHPPLSLDGIAPARTRVIRQPHRGVSAARNAGLAAARGSLITFIDADDLWLPHSLATLLAARHARDTDASVQGRIQRFSAAPGAPPSILGTPFHG